MAGMSPKSSRMTGRSSDDTFWTVLTACLTREITAVILPRTAFSFSGIFILHPGQVHVDCGEHLTQDIMQFPGDALPFVLAHLLDMGGEHAKAFIGFPQFFLRSLSFRNIPPCPEGNHRRTLRDDRQKYLDPEFLAGQIPMDPFESAAAVT